MKEVGLVDHEFSAKALLEDELLVVDGLHPTPDTYEGPLDRFSRLHIIMNHVVVRKFIPEDVPVIPTSSGLRPVLPNDLPTDLVPPAGTPSSSRHLRPILPYDLPTFLTPPAGTPSSSQPRSSPSPIPQANPSPFPQGTLIIEVGTSEENTPSQIPSDLPPMSSLPPPVEALSSSLKHPHREETPSEGTPHSYEDAPGLIFPAPVLTPRLDPRAGSFNMRQATHHSDVETLSLRLMQGLGSFLLAQTSTIPSTVTAMTEKYMVLMKNGEALRKE
ncbi:hypothetical protein Salat_2089900 [Sesamum alatum]|uniref:Uncharacterized protein n=1 Tax=Sesamum alatum TaxID=300844 RepID=A0AAE1Y1B9_9LAMI|nr:hypothetical protein Salat_2089900 [Sesamum alatum]